MAIVELNSGAYHIIGDDDCLTFSEDSNENEDCTRDSGEDRTG